MEEKIKDKDLPYKPYSNIFPVGFEYLAITITKEQDFKLSKIVEKTDRSITELMREAVDRFVD